MTEDDDLLAEAQETLAKIESGEIETVLLDIDGDVTWTTTPEVMDLLLEDPDEAAEILEQVKAFMRQLPPDDDATLGGE